MKNLVMESNTMNLENFLTEDSISLTLEQVNWAASLSQTLATHPRKQWQAYLNSLARLGLIEWLQQRAPELVQDNDLVCDSSQRLLRHGAYQGRTQVPPTAPRKTTEPALTVGQLTLESIHQLQIGSFQLNLIVTDSSMNSEVCVPKFVLEDAPNSQQFFVLVEVIEDLPVLEDSEEQVNISVLGYLTPEQLTLKNITFLDDNLVLLSTDWFEFSPEKLLLFLRCLEPKSTQHQQSVAQDQTRSQPQLNVGNWLKNQLDSVTEDLSWILLPPLAYGLAFRDLRNPMELFCDAVTELKNQAQLDIPYEARTAYREFNWDEVAMRLYVTTWPINTNLNSPEWTLLLLLTAQPSYRLPVGTQLQVRDELQMLENPAITNLKQDYIYAQVIGAYNEQFYVSINFPNGSAITLPPFTFTP